MTADLPDVPPGTRLHLRAGEWQAQSEAIAGTYLDVRVVRVYDAPVGGMVWVRGHLLECAWPDADCTAPWCVEARVSVAAIRDNLAGAR